MKTAISFLFFLSTVSAFAQPQDSIVNYVAWVSSNRVWLATNGVMMSPSNVTFLASAAFNPTNAATASFPSGSITSTGWTNTWTNTLSITYRGTNVSAWKKRSDLVTTNIAYGLMPSGFNTIPLKPGQAIVLSGTSVTGFYDSP